MRAITNAVSILLTAVGILLVPGTSPAGEYGTGVDGFGSQRLIQDQDLIGRPTRFPEPEGEDSIFVSQPAIGRYDRVFYGSPR